MSAPPIREEQRRERNGSEQQHEWRHREQRWLYQVHASGQATRVPAKPGQAASAVFPKEINFQVLIFYKKCWPEKSSLDKIKQRKWFYRRKKIPRFFHNPLSLNPSQIVFSGWHRWC
jgi:hypothetical protein